MTGSDADISALVDALEPNEVSRDDADLDAYAVAGVRPRAVVRPGAIERVQAALRGAHASGLTVVPAGSGANLGALNRPARYDAALATQALDQVIEYDPDNFYVRVQAGCTLRALEEALARKGQRVPVDFPPGGARTIGGLASTPFAGPRRPFLGGPRDVTLGLSAVLADGRLIHAGGVTTKNVSGYDLTRLLIGACGSLATLVEINLRTIPLAEASDAIEATFDAPSAAFGFACAMARSNARPSFATVTAGGGPGGHAPRVWVGAEGFAKDVASQIARFRAAAGDAGASDVREPAAPYTELLCAVHAAAQPQGDDLVVRVSAPMTALHRFAQLAGAEAWIAFVPAGVIVVRAPDEAAQAALGEIDRLCADTGAHRHVVGAPAALRDQIDVWGSGRATADLAAALKKQFDPKGVLAPGVMPGFV